MMLLILIAAAAIFTRAAVSLADFRCCRLRCHYAFVIDFQIFTPLHY